MRKHFFKRNKPSVLLNSAITFPTIRLIDPDGEFIGIVKNQEAQQKARSSELDLICIAEKADPPVCRIMDFGKWNYEKQKADKEKKKKERANRIELHEVQLRPGTDVHDLNVKLKKVQEFVDDGDKVKIVMKLRGREIGNGTMFVDQLKLMVSGQLTECKFDSHPKQFGNKIIATVTRAIDKKNA
jgi:translation initiation factor IF-3